MFACKVKDEEQVRGRFEDFLPRGSQITARIYASLGGCGKNKSTMTTLCVRTDVGQEVVDVLKERKRLLQRVYDSAKHQRSLTIGKQWR